MLWQLLTKLKINIKSNIDWPKAAGYLDTKDQDSIRYVYVPPAKPEQKAPTDTGHCIGPEIDKVDLKN